MELAKERLKIDYSRETAVDDIAIVEAAFDRMELIQLLDTQKKLNEVILTRQSATLVEQKKIDDKENASKSLRGQEKRKIEEHLASLSEIIKFDVRGTLFKMSKKHLMKHEGSYFHAMLSSGRFEPDHDGYYYIDRDPLLFKVILDFMASEDGAMDTGMLTKRQLDQLEKEIDYFQLKSPFAKWRWNEAEKPDGCSISHEGLTVTINTDDCRSIIGTHTIDRYSFKIEIDEFTLGRGCLFVGFSSGIESESDSDSDEDTWLFDLFEFGLFGPHGVYVRDCLFKSLGTGNVITVEKQGGSIRFEKNGISCEISPDTDVPPETDLLYPVISFSGLKGKQITIIS